MRSIINFRKINPFLITLVFGFFLFPLNFSCTSKTETGPLVVHYDRDICHECGMTISDSRFASQIRGGPDHKHSAFFFDDIGCAMKFSKKQKWFSELGTEFYVMDYESGKWAEAKKAFYSKVKQSPMGYNWAAHEMKKESYVDIESVKKEIGE